MVLEKKKEELLPFPASHWSCKIDLKFYRQAGILHSCRGSYLGIIPFASTFFSANTECGIYIKLVMKMLEF